MQLVLRDRCYLLSVASTEQAAACFNRFSFCVTASILPRSAWFFAHVALRAIGLIASAT